MYKTSDNNIYLDDKFSLSKIYKIFQTKNVIRQKDSKDTEKDS